MRLFHLAALILPFVLAQDPSSARASVTPAAAPSNSAIANQTLTTTTITSLVSSGSASPSPTAIVLTLTLNSTSTSPLNATLGNSTTSSNGTLTNGTAANAMVPWKEDDDWIPFTILIDPAYGVLGALLIITGVPVAVLGGKNRWSSLAIASGYSFMLFTLVMILGFGVQPNIQPPSPNPPTQLLRGLYLLVCIIASIIGGGIGIFLWKFAKYWVSATGGFAFGWFLLALRPGGTITNAIGRWGLLCVLTVGAFVASLPEKVNPWMMLIGTAWIGATAFMLGVDCYTRAGLKEFYIYNLGFWDLFPKLESAKYPLTQTISIELGILAAMVVVGAAIQFRVLNILQKRIKELKDEEEAREDAAEVHKAAERFKNLESEQTEWEDKYGSVSGGPSDPGHASDTPSPSALLHLGFADPRRARSQSSPLSQQDKGRYETLSLHSPTLGEMQRPGSSAGMMTDEREVMRDELGNPFAGGSGMREDDEIENKLKLLDEVRQARLSIRSSIDQLRAQTPTLSIGAGAQDGVATTTNTPTSDRFSDHHVRRMSGSSSRMLDGARTPIDRSTPVQPTRPQSEWERYTSDRNIITPTLPSPAALAPDSLRPTSYRQSSYGPAYETPAMDRRERTTSMMEMKVSDFGAMPHQRQSTHETYPMHEPLRRTESANANIAMSRPTTTYDFTRSVSQYDTAPAQRSNPGMITGFAARGYDSQPHPRSAGMQRTMTYEELADRHRKRISKLQDPVSSKMNEEVALAQAKEKWERQKRYEKEAMRKREAEKMMRQKEKEKELAQTGRPTGAAGAREESLQKAEEWRRSVHNGLDVMTGQRPTGQPHRGSTYGQQGQVMGKRRVSSHMAN